jgi:hypothetical protein
MSIWGRMQKIEDRVEQHGTALTQAVTLLTSHVQSCDKRGARTEKLGYIAISLVIAVLGFLVKPYFEQTPRLPPGYYLEVPTSPGTPKQP